MDNLTAVDILLVEDNPRDAELVTRALKKNGLANQLFIVGDGEEALDFLFCRNIYAARKGMNAPRVVLLDLKLPKIDGLEVLKEIKSDETLKTIPVVMVTSSAEDPDIKSAYALGANSYVVKPVNFDSFVNAMSQLGFYWLLVNQSPKQN